MSHWGGTEKESVRRINVQMYVLKFLCTSIYILLFISIWTWKLYDLSFPVWYIMLWISILYLGISIFTLSLSIFIPCYCILIVSSSFTVWNDFYFRFISDRLSDISKISMIICRWYVLLLDFHTEKDYFKRENKLFFCYNIFLDTNWKF